MTGISGRISFTEDQASFASTQPRATSILGKFASDAFIFLMQAPILKRPVMVLANIKWSHKCPPRSPQIHGVSRTAVNRASSRELQPVHPTSREKHFNKGSHCIVESRAVPFPCQTVVHNMGARLTSMARRAY
jgi:hypothetical protein